MGLGAVAAAFLALLAVVVFLLVKVQRLSGKMDETPRRENNDAVKKRRLSTASSGIIEFADSEVKEICVENWDSDGDGELSRDEAAGVKDLGANFKNNKNIRSFDELRYFTGLELLERSAFNQCSNLQHVMLPDQITVIDDFAFLQCESLKEIQFPAKLEKIGVYGFNECHSLTTVSFPRSLKSISDDAFGACRNLTSVKFDDSSVTLGPWCFTSCPKLNDVTLGQCVECLEDGVFFECVSLRSVKIPDSAKSLGADIFHNCHQLSDVYVGDGVTSIGKAAFYGDDSLKVLSLPSVDVFKAGLAFASNSLEKQLIETVVIRHGDAGKYSFDRIFEKVDERCRYIVPKGTLQSYLDKGYKNVEETK